MTCIQNKLMPICLEVEMEVKPRLQKFIEGAIIRNYLPQQWVFKTESETVTFKVDNNGNASVKSGSVSKPDVIIDTDHDFLAAALTTRTTPPFQPKRFKITPKTPKGRTAFDYLRKYLGL